MPVQKYIQQTIKTTPENRKKIVLRHRLIAWEFCVRDIDFQTNQVNHIDGIKYPIDILIKRITSIHLFLRMMS